jgi:hypothetical protein
MWYVLIIVDDYSHYSLIFFLDSKDEMFEHFQSLALRLNNEHPNYLKAIRSYFFVGYLSGFYSSILIRFSLG